MASLPPIASFLSCEYNNKNDTLDGVSASDPPHRVLCASLAFPPSLPLARLDDVRKHLRACVILVLMATVVLAMVVAAMVAAMVVLAMVLLLLMIMETRPSSS